MPFLIYLYLVIIDFHRLNTHLPIKQFLKFVFLVWEIKFQAFKNAVWNEMYYIFL